MKKKNVESNLGLIYALQKLNDLEDVKIGSTLDFIQRMFHYITPEKNFDKTTHKIWKFVLLESNYYCYTLDSIIQHTSKKSNLPYKHFDGTGGKEHYYFICIDDLKKYFDILQIKYKYEEVDVNLMRKTMKNIINKENYDTKKVNINNDILKDVDNKLLLYQKPSLVLHKFQQDILTLVNNAKKRLFHLIIAPTGTGKTITFTSILLRNMVNQKKNVLIVTKKKEILNQVVDNISENIQKIINSKIVNINFTPKIIDCTDYYTVNKINKLKQNPCVYIINFDKFTNTNIDYKKINFDNFGMMIIDEAHWVGAEKII